MITERIVNEHQMSIKERIEMLSIDSKQPVSGSQKSSLNGEKKKGSSTKKKSSKLKKKKPVMSRNEPDIADGGGSFSSGKPPRNDSRGKMQSSSSSSWITSSTEIEDTEILAPFESPSTSSRKTASKSSTRVVGEESKEDGEDNVSGQISPKKSKNRREFRNAVGPRGNTVFAAAAATTSAEPRSMSDVGPLRPSSRPANVGKPKMNLSELFKRKVKKVIVMNRLFSHKNYDKLAKAEKNADKASYKRSKSALRRASTIRSGEKKKLIFSDNLVIVIEIEDLTRKNTSWGDVWEDLYMDEDTLASIKYEAFEQECRRAEEGYVSDDFVEPYTSLEEEEENEEEQDEIKEDEEKVEEQKPKKRNLKDLFRRKARRIIMFNRMFGGNNINQLDEKERNVDRNSFRRSSKMSKKIELPIDLKVGVTFALELVTVYEIEDLTKRNTSWGDVWDDLYFDEETLAEFKYNAFLEECEREANGGIVWDDDSD